MSFQGLQAEVEDPRDQSDRCPSDPGWGGVGGLLWWAFPGEQEREAPKDPCDPLVMAAGGLGCHQGGCLP